MDYQSTALTLIIGNESTEERRTPQGVECSFQKHASRSFGKQLRSESYHWHKTEGSIDGHHPFSDNGESVKWNV